MCSNKYKYYKLFVGAERSQESLICEDIDYESILKTASGFGGVYCYEYTEQGEPTLVFHTNRSAGFIMAKK